VRFENIRGNLECLQTGDPRRLVGQFCGHTMRVVCWASLVFFGETLMFTA
jgi:hypothetical protein